LAKIIADEVPNLSVRSRDTLKKIDANFMELYKLVGETGKKIAHITPDDQPF
jgi:hypothetical protein